MNAWSDDLINLAPDDSVLASIHRVTKLVHHKDWNAFVKQFLFGDQDLFAPKAYHQELREFLELFFKHFVKYDSIILKGKELHFSKLKENYGIHVFRFGVPVNLKHWTQVFVFRREDLQFIIHSIPSLNESGANVLLGFLIIVFKLNHFFVIADGFFALIKLTTSSFFSSFFSVFCPFLNRPFDLNVVFVELILAKLFLFIL
jgi:hypothetical protein